MADKIIIQMDAGFIDWFSKLGGVKDNEQIKLVAWWAYCEGKKNQEKKE